MNPLFSLQFCFCTKIELFFVMLSHHQVHSWGNGDGGRLGHGDSNSREEPTLVQELQGKTVVSIACGSTYSAAITTQGELYTWGRGNYGRLGHGSSDDHSVPTLVTALKGMCVFISHKPVSFT